MSIFRQLFTTSVHEEIKKESSSLTFLDEKDCETDFNTNSRLSKNLIEIISDKNCICYFVQFLETKNALSLIKFYLDAENFKTVVENSLKIASRTITSKIELKQKQNENLERNSKRVITDKSDDMSFEKTLSSEYCDNNEHVTLKYLREEKKYVKNDNDDRGDISGIVVPELKNLCDLSMRKPLTDDEKSRIIYAENKSKKNKEQQQKYDIENLPVKTPLSSSRKFNTSVATDAVRIYKKYLTLNSQYFIDIPATITSTISLALCAQHDNDEIESPSAVTDPSNNINSNEPSSLTTDSDTDCDNEKVTTITISPNCFEEAKRYVFERMENEYLNEFLESVFYCKYCLEILTNFKNLKLSDILYNESAIFYFMEYLEQEKKQIYLEFWMAAINFREHYHNKCKIYNNQNDYNEDSNTKESNGHRNDNTENDNLIKDAQNDAMILYEKYFSLQSSNPLNISNNIRCKIEELICSKKLLQISKCFDSTLKLIENYLEINYFEKFLKSQLYSNYLNELRNKLKNDDNFNFYNTNNQLPPLTPLTNARKLLTPSLSLNKKNQQQQKNDEKLQRNGRGHRKTMSDCTNENTKCLRIIGDISQHNTLLAMENSSSYLNSNKLMNNRIATTATASSSNNMQIETKYLINPDLLWHRNSMITSLPTGTKYGGNYCGSSGSSGGGLTFGRVDALGRYERDFDLMEIHDNKDNKWSLGGNKIKNAVRKLVNLPEEKVQEEIAWQVAELIVKDITSITLGNNYNMNPSTAASVSATTTKTAIPLNSNNTSSSGCGEGNNFRKVNNDDNSNSNTG